DYPRPQRLHRDAPVRPAAPGALLPHRRRWPAVANVGGPTDVNSLDVATSAIYTACLSGSSVTFWLLLTMLHGGAFLYGEAREFGDLSSRGGSRPPHSNHSITILLPSYYHVLKVVPQ